MWTAIAIVEFIAAAIIFAIALYIFWEFW